MKITILCLVLSAVAISADLQSDIADVASRVDMEQLELVGQRYMAVKPEVFEALRFVEENQMQPEQIAHDFVQLKEVHELVSYFESRNIDIEGVWVELLKIQLEFYKRIVNNQHSARQMHSATPAISGNFYMDMMLTLFSSNLAEVLREKSEESPEFAHLMEAIHDQEFRQLFYRLAFQGKMGGLQTRDIETRSLWGCIRKILGF